VRETTTTERDQALRRLRRTTSVTLAAAGTLVAAFAGLAAKALPGHHTATIANARVPATARRATPAPPPLVPVQSASAPAAPASPPAQTQAPPVVVSGGT
jgi:hypothetical protein